MSRLAPTDSVATVGAISLGLPSQRTIARLTDRSLKLSNATRATMATANVPKECGPSSRASTIPIGSVPTLAMRLLPKLQPSAREASRPSDPPPSGGRLRCLPFTAAAAYRRPESST